MRSLAFSLGLAAASMVAATLLAQETQPKAAVRRDASSMESAEVQAIRATAVAFEKAFDAGDAQALAALWTPQGDYVDENGMLSQGREAIEKKYASLFQQRPGMKMKIDVASIRLLGPNVAMEDGSAALISEAGHAISASRYAAVHTKDQGKWLLSAVRDMPVEASSNEALKALEHFIGDWVARRDEATVHTHCRWIAAGRFLERTYTVKKKDAAVVSGTQIIGWDPAAQVIRSWTFDSTGGHGQGAWTAVEGGWVIESEGVLADGALSSSTELLRLVGDNILGWQSVDRVAGGQPLADTEEVVLERVIGSKQPDSQPSRD